MMNIEHIKSLSLKDYLANKGHYPVKEYTTYGMYRSPFREESSPSFKVDYRASLWYDFGIGEGGSIIDLVMKLHGCTVSQAIGLLENRVEISPLMQNDFDRQVESREKMKIIEAVSLHHPNLLRYLQDRKIDWSVAKRYCREIHYQVKGRTYYAIGMPNPVGLFINQKTNAVMKTIENRNTNDRPPKRPVEKKKYKVTLKMATEEFYSLKAKARLAGITRSEYIRRCIATSIVRQRLSPELMNHLRQLSGMANNVNQIAHKANAMGYARVYQDNLAMTERLDNIIKRIEDDC